MSDKSPAAQASKREPLFNSINRSLTDSAKRLKPQPMNTLGETEEASNRQPNLAAITPATTSEENQPAHLPFRSISLKTVTTNHNTPRYP